MARFLLDTHAVLWALAEPGMLSRPARMALEDARSEVFVSVVSGWEIAIERALGKLEAPDNLEAAIRMQGFDPILVTFQHAEQAGGLPPYHRDPFDRMLIAQAQAQAEGLTIVTRDSGFSFNDVRTLTA